MTKIKICIIENQALFRDGLAALIKQTPNLELFGKYANGETFLDDLKGFDANETLIALVDLSMPGISGAELTTVLRQKFPNVKTIILTVYDSPLHVLRAIDAGAAAYLEKGCFFDEIIETIEKVYHAGYYYSDYVQKIMKVDQDKQTVKAGKPIAVTISNREKEILQLICKEHSSAEIANKLNLSTRTVENHRNTLLEKTNSRDTAGLVLFAVKHDLLLATGN